METPGPMMAIDGNKAMKVKTSIPQLIRWGVTLVAITVSTLTVVRKVGESGDKIDDMVRIVTEQGRQISSLQTQVAILNDRAGVSSLPNRGRGN